MTRNDALFRARFPNLTAGSKPIVATAKAAPAVTADAKPVRHSFAHLRNAVFTSPPAAPVSAIPTRETQAAKVEAAKHALKIGNVVCDADVWAARRGKIEAAKQALKAGNVVCDADVWAARRGG